MTGKASEIALSHRGKKTEETGNPSAEEEGLNLAFSLMKKRNRGRSYSVEEEFSGGPDLPENTTITKPRGRGGDEW